MMGSRALTILTASASACQGADRLRVSIRVSFPAQMIKIENAQHGRFLLVATPYQGVVMIFIQMSIPYPGVVMIFTQVETPW